MNRAMKVLGIILLFAAFDWLVVLTPVVACALAIAIAIAWCLFLERYASLPGVK